MKLYSNDYIRQVTRANAEKDFVDYINSFNEQFQIECIRINPQIFFLIKNRSKEFNKKVLAVQPMLHYLKKTPDEKDKCLFTNKVIFDKKIKIILNDNAESGICPIHGDKLEKVAMKVVMQNISRDFIYKGAFCKQCRAFYITNSEFIKQKEELLNRKNQVICSGGLAEVGGSVHEILIRRNIKYLIHFTRMQNIYSILKHGVLSRYDLEKQSLDYCFNDNDRYDGKVDCSCFTIEYPNYYNLKRFMEKYSDEKWVIILLDANFLMTSINYYAFHNASSNCVRCRINELVKPKDFEAMFANNLTVHLTDRNREYHRGGVDNMQPYLPTSDQAEILVKGKVDNRFIKKIYFMNEDDKMLFKSRCRNDIEMTSVDLVVNQDMFIVERQAFKFERR